MRALKTKFPCRQCGAPCEVRRLSDGEHIRCAPCAKWLGDAGLANWKWERARKLYRERNGTTTYLIELAALMAEPVELAMAAAKYAFRVAFARLGEPKPNPVHAAQWVRAGRSWLKWAENVSRQLRELTEHEADLAVVLKRRGLKVIDGGLDAPKDEM